MSLLPSLDPSSLLVGAVVLLCLLWWKSTRRPPGLPPGPGLALPLLGHLHLMPKDPRAQFLTWRRQYGDVFSLYMGSKMVVVLASYSAIREALVTFADVFSDRPHTFMSDHIFNNKGIVFTSGHQWKEQRKTGLEILRAMGMGKNMLAEKIQEEITHYIQAIKDHQGAPVNLAQMTQVSISNNICSILFGKRFHYDDPEFISYLKIFDENFKLLVGTAILNFIPSLRYIPGDLFKGKEAQTNIGRLHSFIDNLVADHRKTLDEEVDKVEDPDFIYSYLDKIKEQNVIGNVESTLNDENLQKGVSTLFAAGTETTSSGLQWAMLFFLHNPHVQDKCFKEISDVIGLHRLPAMRDRPKMIYVEATICEVLRKGDVVPLAGMHAAAYDVRFRDYVIPKGTTIIPNLSCVLQDPEIWGDPENFRPERFIDPDEKLIKLEEFIPFGAGRRMCLGESLARMELFLYLATLIQHFRFLPAEEGQLPPLEGVFGITCAPCSYEIRAVPRMCWSMSVQQSAKAIIQLLGGEVGSKVIQHVLDVSLEGVPVNGLDVPHCAVDRLSLGAGHFKPTENSGMVRGDHVVDPARMDELISLSVQDPVEDVAASVVGSLLHTLCEVEPRHNVQHLGGPGPALPLLGHLHLMPKDPRAQLMTWRRQYGDVFSLYMGGKLVVVLASYSAIREALVTFADVFSDRPHDFNMDQVIKDKGLVGSSGATWKEQRKTSLEILRAMGMGKNLLAEKIQEEIIHYIQAIKDHQGAPVDLAQMTQVSISNNICSISLGKRFDYEDPEFTNYLQCINENFKLLGGTAILTFLPVLGYIPGDPLKKNKVLANAEAVHRFVGKHVTDHQKTLEEVEVENADFISRYLHKARVHKAREENLQNTVADLFIAGSETVPTALQWALLFFLHHPHVQDKCFEEISDVIGLHRLPTMRDRPKLTYLEATICEVLRKGDIGPFTGPHTCAHDFTFRGYGIPKGATVLPFLTGVLQDPKIWGDPEKFQPERFIDPDGNLKRFEELIPFGTGRRVCLGESLARMELFLYLATLIQHFRFLPAEEQLPPLEGVFGITVSPRPYKIRALSRM
ncbi:uncharacterized protein LOC143280261 [Babylonia areolata]|uniref:uncharacterized protein LOC143280261 n=1 Tax=Babylonia areolata TaxID=304850 RepID=UPI003FD51E6D